jgi:hypothetical protein
MLEVFLRDELEALSSPYVGQRKPCALMGWSSRHVGLFPKPWHAEDWNPVPHCLRTTNQGYLQVHLVSGLVTCDYCCCYLA